MQYFAGLLIDVFVDILSFYLYFLALVVKETEKIRHFFSFIAARIQ